MTRACTTASVVRPGDAIKFVQEIEQSSFHETIVKVIELSELSESEKKSLKLLILISESSQGGDRVLQAKGRVERGLIGRLLKTSITSRKYLSDPKAGQARMHLIDRNISPETVFKFKLGYAPAL